MAQIRLQTIAHVDREWYQQIMSFVEKNPLFQPLLPYASLTKHPIGFNKNPGENYDPDAPRNIFETLIYCIAESGVNAKYGYKQYRDIVNYFRQTDYYEENMEFPFKIQPKKIQVYKDLINVLLDKDIDIPNMTLEDLEHIKTVKGIGPTALAMCHQLYGDGQYIPYTDRYFIGGFKKLYNIDKPTKKQIIEATNNWDDKRVGTMFIYQCYHYYQT